MRPISRGRGPQGYSLYIPVTWPQHGPVLDAEALLAALRQHFGTGLAFTRVDGAVPLLLKVGEFVDEAKATEMFDYINKVLAFIAIESGAALWFYDELEPIGPGLGWFPRGWKAGADAGWELAQREVEAGQEYYAQGYPVDGMVHLLYPAIVPEHQRIVAPEAMLGYPVRGIRAEAIESAVAQVPLSGPPFRTLAGAVRACMNAYASENPALRFMSMVTCLEILAQATVSPALDPGRDRALAALVEVVKRSDNSEDDDYKAIVRRFEGWAASVSRPSAINALDRLLREHADAISERLPMDHPARESFDGMAAAIYGLRSKVAHGASLGRYVDERMHRAEQFLRTALAVLMGQALRAPSGRNDL